MKQFNNDAENQVHSIARYSVHSIDEILVLNLETLSDKH